MHKPPSAYGPSNSQIVNAAIGLVFRAAAWKKVSEHASEGVGFIPMARDLARTCRRIPALTCATWALIGVKLLASR